jgi:hypothetical protein
VNTRKVDVLGPDAAAVTITLTAELADPKTKQKQTVNRAYRLCSFSGMAHRECSRDTNRSRCPSTASVVRIAFASSLANSDPAEHSFTAWCPPGQLPGPSSPSYRSSPRYHS